MVVWLKMLKWTPTLYPRLQQSHSTNNRLELMVTESLSAGLGSFVSAEVGLVSDLDAG